MTPIWKRTAWRYQKKFRKESIQKSRQTASRLIDKRYPDYISQTTPCGLISTNKLQIKRRSNVLNNFIPKRHWNNDATLRWLTTWLCSIHKRCQTHKNIDKHSGDNRQLLKISIGKVTKPTEKKTINLLGSFLNTKEFYKRSETTNSKGLLKVKVKEEQFAQRWPQKSKQISKWSNLKKKSKSTKICLRTVIEIPSR